MGEKSPLASPNQAKGIDPEDPFEQEVEDKGGQGKAENRPLISSLPNFSSLKYIPFF
jgi:hypothetical protein